MGIGESAVSGFVLWPLIIITVLGIVAIVFILRFKGKFRPQNQDDVNLEQMLTEYGYAYDQKQNIFYSRMDAWQRKYGYCRLYDEACAPLSMIVDCEPIHFEYRGKRWLIELWKGQYGMTTGGEIGVYNTDASDLNIPEVFSGTFYESVTDEEQLAMSFILRKGKKVLFKRNGIHWWLTGFILGEFSEPSELIMEAAITLKNQEMREAFTDRLLEMGYTGREIGILGNTVRLTFSEPRSLQPYTRTEWVSRTNQRKNRFLCLRYRYLAKDSPDMYTTLNTIYHRSPTLFSLIMHIGKPEKLYQAYEAIARYLNGTHL